MLRNLLKKINLKAFFLLAISGLFFFVIILFLNNYFLGYGNKQLTIEDIPSLFINYYANWHNNYEHKNKVLSQIQDAVNLYRIEKNKTIKLEELELLENKTLHKIQQLVYNFSDAHVTLEINPKKSTPRHLGKVLKSQIKIDFTTLTLDACMGCEKLIGLKIVGINELDLFKWDSLAKVPDFPLVSFSSDHGRLYKKMKFLETYPANDRANNLIKSIQLENQNKNKINLLLKWSEVDTTQQYTAPECVKFQRIAEDRVTIHIINFWCNSLQNSSFNRKSMIINFKQQYLNAIKQVNLKDQITIDVSGNSGGGDEEVDLVLSSLITHKKNINYYSYQFLKRTALIEKSFSQIKNVFKSFFDFQSEWISVADYQVNWDYQIAKNNFIGHQVKEIKTSPLCSSSCELFVLALKQSQLFKIVGGPTQGSLGLPITYRINTPYADHDATLSLPSCRIFDDKKQFMEGIGAGIF